MLNLKANNNQAAFGTPDVLSLREFYQFQHDGKNYLFNVATLTPFIIPESVAQLIGKLGLSSSDEYFVDEGMMEDLKNLDLIESSHSSSYREQTTQKTQQPIRQPVKSRHSVGAIALFVAQECNMACVYCYGNGGEYANKSMMKEDVALKAVDWLMDNSNGIETVNISFFGGEPLMNFPLVKKVVSYARQEGAKNDKKVTFSLITNAAVLSDQHVAFLQEEKITPQVSFDGSPEIQNRQRPFKNGKGSYDVAYVNIQKLKKAFANLQARATLHGETDPAEMRSGLEQAGFKSYIIKKSSDVILDNPSVAKNENQNSELSDLRMISVEKSISDDLLQNIKARKLGQEITNGTIWSYLSQFISGKKKHYHCGVGKGLAAISTTGDIYPCHRFVGQEDMKMGNIADYSPTGINNYHRAVVDNLPECKTCWARYNCGGGCFYDNKASHGDTRMPDRAYCQEVYAMMKMAIVLYLKMDEEDKNYFMGCLKGQKT